ncbi:hypothetical protein [Gemmatimonas sp.]|uniref:hypothetical protein n=1 Tax=Gemmatimonas sp. TaxID=1962908 RepID=UPI003DA21A38
MTPQISFPARARVVSTREKKTSTVNGHEVVCVISGTGITEQQIEIEVADTTSAGAAETAALRLLQRWCREYLKAATPPGQV